MSYQFDWDLNKAASNLQNHGVSFDEAASVFYDSLAMLGGDPAHSVGEERLLLIGMSSGNRLLVVSHVERPPWTRLISARPATAYERQQYEQGV